MIRLSVTDLDSYRYWKGSEDMELEALLRRLRKEEPPTDPMMAGRALHGVLEDASWSEADAAERDGFKFRFVADCVVPWLPVRELKGEMVLNTSVGPVTLVGVVDGLDGSVYDHKLTERFDAERYADSYQWRCYLTMFGAQKFVYNVFVGREDMPRCWLIQEFHQLPFYAYPAMARDVQREVGEFAEFVAKYLPERVMKEAA